MDKKLGRNDPCWCGSGKKYKQCHMREDESGASKKSFTPMGKRKFKAKVLNMGGKSQSVFKQASAPPPKPEELKFDKTSEDFQVKVKKEEKPLFPKAKEEKKKPTPNKGIVDRGEEFKPTTEDWQEKE